MSVQKKKDSMGFVRSKGHFAQWEACSSCGGWVEKDDTCQSCGYGPGKSTPHKTATASSRKPAIAHEPGSAAPSKPGATK